MDVESLRNSLSNMKILASDVNTQNELFEGASLHAATRQTAEGLQVIGMLRAVPAGMPLARVRKSPSPTLKRAVHRGR